MYLPRIVFGPAPASQQDQAGAQQQQVARAYFGRGLHGCLLVFQGCRHGGGKLACADGQAQCRHLFIQMHTFLKKARWPFGISAPVFMSSTL